MSNPLLLAYRYATTTMCKQVFQIFVQKYTKSFGGKIWKNLHRVSPYTIFGKKIYKTSF